MWGDIIVMGDNIVVTLVSVSNFDANWVYKQYMRLDGYTVFKTRHDTLRVNSDNEYRGNG